MFRIDPFVSAVYSPDLPISFPVESHILLQRQDRPRYVFRWYQELNYFASFKVALHFMYLVVECQLYPLTRAKLRALDFFSVVAIRLNE